MHSLQDAAIHELAEIAAHGLRRYVEVGRESAHIDATIGPGPNQDLALTLVCLQRLASLRRPAVTPATPVSLPEWSGISEPGWAYSDARFV